MTKYFTIPRVKSAIEHLQNFDSKWVLVPLVFAVNGVNADSPISPNSDGRPGTDSFFDRYFDGSLIDLPPKASGNSMRPRFSDVRYNSEDYIVHQSIKLWGTHYSSRGYREMENITEREGRSSGTTYKLKPEFWAVWQQKLPSEFQFEELLVWLYAFTGMDDSINSWEELFVDFQEKHMGVDGRFDEGYRSRFSVGNSVDWPNEFLETRPTDDQYRIELYPSEYVAPGISMSFGNVVTEFQDNISDSGIRFGEKHDEFITRFLSSLVTKQFLILTGLSGSGKTQIALKFGEWLGPNNHLLVPVRPDWTSGDALFGYENALDTSSNPSWYVPSVLEFILSAVRNPDDPYVLILDEMNLAHVERYFGDFLSGMESGKAVIPNLSKQEDGKWRIRLGSNSTVAIPDNLFVVGTVNVDETTYMFSPKVLDRANTIEFRVNAEDLDHNLQRPQNIEQGSQGALRTLLALAKDRGWHSENLPEDVDEYAEKLRQVHRLLAPGGYEFGHRVFQEAIRFYAFFKEAGYSSWQSSLDIQIYQKILPRLHGSQRKLGPTLRRIAAFCYDPEQALEGAGDTFNPESVDAQEAILPSSFGKLQYMYSTLMANQFTSFTE